MSDSTILHKGWYAWIGRRVCVRQVDVGTLKYFGEIKSENGFWCGVEFDQPIGKTDGVISSVRYFKCKANHGIFVPMNEVSRIKSRSVELNNLSDLSKFKSSENCFVDDKITQIKFDTTFDASENKNAENNSGYVNSDAQSKPTDFVVDKRHVNVCKRSKNSYSRFGTEDSLGILSNLLDEDESWNLLDNSNTNEKSLIRKKNDEVVEDSVFSPPVKTSLYSSNKPHTYGRLSGNAIQNYFDIKCTSTPKQCLNNIFDLGATVNLDQDQFYDYLHEEIEPIIAGSSGPKSMDFDLTKFKNNEILCSTSKLTIPLLPDELSLFEEVPCIKNDRNEKDHLFTHKAKDRNNLADTAPVILNGCINKPFSSAQEIPGNLDILNATYKINPEILKSPIACVMDLSHVLNFESNDFNSDKHSDGIIDFNSTFVLPNDSTEKESQADKTFVIDHSPVKAMEDTLSTESETNFEKKSLSIIFEKASNENLSVIDGAELVEVCSTNISSLKPDSNKTLITSEHSSNSIEKLTNSLNSSSKIADIEPITSDLNSTFCISSDENKHKKSAAFQEANKRHSLSAIYEKNNLPVKKEISNIVKRKSIKQPQSFNTQKTVFKAPDSHAASTSAIKSNIIKKSTIATFVSKKVEMQDQNVLKDSSLKSSSKDNLKTNCSSSIANMTAQFKKSIDSCKALYKQTRQEENATHVAFKITEKNAKITARRKSIGGLDTKVISKISYTSSKISISEHSNANRKGNSRTDSNGLNAKNLADMKHNSIKRRHTMLPTILANGTQAKQGLAKSKSDLSNNASTVAKSTNTFKNTNCVQTSKTHQSGLGDKKENAREITMKKPAPVERILENNSKDLTKLDNKQNKNPNIPKRELLKPGTLSRLPIPGKSIKKPGFISNSVEPQQRITNNNLGGKQRAYMRLPLQKLQDQSS